MGFATQGLCFSKSLLAKKTKIIKSKDHNHMVLKSLKKYSLAPLPKEGAGG
jgi:hypothetical protein